MANEGRVEIHLRDLPVDDETRESLRDELHSRCLRLGEEFPEAMSFELTLTPVHDDIEAHAKASGKNTRAAAHATANEARVAGDRALDKLERELRTHHDKRIFAPRREAQRSKADRTG